MSSNWKWWRVIHNFTDTGMEMICVEVILAIQAQFIRNTATKIRMELCCIIISNKHCDIIIICLLNAQKYGESASDIIWCRFKMNFVLYTFHKIMTTWSAWITYRSSHNLRLIQYESALWFLIPLHVVYDRMSIEHAHLPICLAKWTTGHTIMLQYAYIW